MPIYRVGAAVTIRMYTVVEADTMGEALAGALFHHAPVATVQRGFDERSCWMTDENLSLEVTRDNITGAGPVG